LYSPITTMKFSGFISIYFLIYFFTNSYYVKGQCFDCTTSVPINSGLVWCHPFDGNANDASNNGYNGTVNNVTFVNDRFNNPNKAASFNAFNSNVDITKTFPDLTSLSFSFWFKPNNISTQSSCLFWEGNSLCGQDITIGINAGQLYIRADKSGATLIGLTDPSAAYTLPSNFGSSWHHFVWTMSPTQSKIYIDTILVKTSNATGSGVGAHYIPSYGCKYDGNNAPCGGPKEGFYDGSIDDSRLYNRVLSFAEVKQLYYNVNTNMYVGPGSTICKGDSVQINAYGGLSYLWSPAGSLSGTAISNPFAKPLLSTKYAVKIINGSCQLIDTVRITVNSVTVSKPTDPTICQGDSVRLIVSGGVTYLWKPNNTLSDSTIFNPYAKPPSTTKYYFKVVNNSCSLIDSVTVNVTQVSSNADVDKNICVGDSVQLIGSAIGAFKWKPTTYMNDSNLISPYVKPPSSISYILTATQGACSRVDTVKVNVSNASAYAGLDKNICLGDSVQLDGVATGSFTWQPTTAMSSPTQIKPYVKPVSDTKYILKASFGSCVQRDTVDVFVTQVLANAGKNLTVCLGDSVQLQATALGNITWQPSTFLNNPSLIQPYSKPTTNIDYIFTATNGTCVQKDTVSVSLFTNASANAGADQRICAGSGVFLNAAAANTYEWTPPYFITNSNSQTPFVNPLVDTTYYLKISMGSCFGFDTVKVKVVPIPSVNASDDTKVCLGDSVQLNAHVSSPAKWVWRSQVQLSDSNILNPKAKITQSSIFIIIASDTSKLCYAFDTMIVDPYPVVKAIYSSDTYSGEGQVKPVFDNISQNATKYTWLFGDSLNTSSKDKNPDFTFIRPGVYKVKLIAQNDYGCKDSITKEFTVLPAGKFYIPNAFTPNGDMFNEVFKFVYPESAYKKVEMTIYNRWGGFIYETSMPGGKWWDGTFEGAPCSEDVYFYVAKAIKVNGEISDYHGTITLLR